MSYQGLPIRSHADRILHRVADLLRRSTLGLSDWTGGRIYVLADLLTIPDGDWPMITLAHESSSWTLAVGGRGERSATVAIGIYYEETGVILNPHEGTGAEVWESVVRTLTADAARTLLPADPEDGARSWGVLDSLQDVFWSSLQVERDGEVYDTGRLLGVEARYTYEVDLETGHPQGLTDND